jgi:hypothetical protein
MGRMTNPRPKIVHMMRRWITRMPRGDMACPILLDKSMAKNLKVGVSSLWTLAERNTKVNGIPKAA